MKTQNFFGLILILGLILFVAPGRAQAQNSCFSEDPGAGSTDRQAHYNWAQQQDADQLRGNLIYKLNLLARCPAMSDDKLSSAFASISVIIFRYTANANCFNQGFINADWSVHKRWAAANGRQQTYSNLQWRTATGIKCLARAGQIDYFADVSVAIANAPFAGGGLPPPPPPPPPPPGQLPTGTWKWTCCSGRYTGTIVFGRANGKDGMWYGAGGGSIENLTVTGNQVKFHRTGIAHYCQAGQSSDLMKQTWTGILSGNTIKGSWAGCNDKLYSGEFTMERLQ